MTSFPVPLSLYLHIPFCRTKCTYCAFNTYVNLEALIEPFVRALIREVEIVGTGNPGYVIGTIYFGGGTPSLLKPEQIARILAVIHSCFIVSNDAEISLEANPNDLDYSYLKALRQLGINRLSIGMQTANANELALFARRHDNDTVMRAVSSARRAGFDNLNLDLIYGFPHQTLESWDASLRQLLALQPEHISLYALGLEDGTPMAVWVSRGRLPTPDDDLTADMYERAADMLAAAGYEQYEISNWSKPGFASRHNLQYWRNLPYVGLGPGAHGYAAGIRYSTVLSPHNYIQVLETSVSSYGFPYTPATDQAIVVDRAGEIAETLMMGLRLTQEGIPRHAFSERFGSDLLEIHGTTIEKFKRYGLLYVDTEVVRLTQRGRLLSNVVFRELI
jgi:oxygen-independent coproporphyrinogen-3 oxidase